MEAPRIHETVVPARFPESGHIVALIVGEAPGPRGADKSSHPWWGDEAGKLLFKALHRGGFFRSITLTPPTGLFQGEAERIPIGSSFEACPHLSPWSGSRFAKEGILPVIEGVALSNAWPICPTGDGKSFHRPKEAQMAAPDNKLRMFQEISTCLARSPGGGLRVIALGTAAAWFLGECLNVEQDQSLRLTRLPHPAPQGILSWIRKIRETEGRDLTVPAARERWIEALLQALT